MEFRLLGLLEVVSDDGPVQIVRGRESALLALLLIHANDPLSAERIVEELWAGEAPENAIKSVHIYISRLRKALGADRIETTRAGYRIDVAPGELDVERFAQLGREGRQDEALMLWRGEPLADFQFDAFAQNEIRRLNELHDAVVADRIDVAIAAGRAHEQIADLNELLERAPLWERPRAQLMHALYLSGRQADALELYRDTRALLADELGVDPGPELQQLERAILNQDESLGTPARPIVLAERRRRLRLLLAGGLLLTAAAIAAAVVALEGSGGGLSTIQSNAVAAIDPAMNRIVAQVSTGNRPSRLAAGRNVLWVLDASDGIVSEIDAQQSRLLASFATASVPTDVVATPTMLWVGNAFPAAAKLPLGGVEQPASISRFDSVHRGLAGTTTLPHPRIEPFSGRPPEERLLVAGAGSVWAIGPTLEPVQLDATSGRLRRVIHVPATSLAYGNGALWALDGATIRRIDPHSGRVTGQFEIPSLFNLGGIAAGGGLVWASSPFEGLVWRVDPGPPRSIRSVQLAFGASTVAYGFGSLWVGNDVDDSISRIDPKTDAVRNIATIPAPQDIAVGSDRVWVASGSTADRAGQLQSSACGPVVYSGKGTPKVLIASDFALHGDAVPYTRPMELTVESVLRAHHFRAGRFSVGYQSCDDATQAAGGSDLGQCLANARAFATDQSVLGIIGPSDSQCARAEIPVTNRAPRGPLAMISPLSTGPFLTRRGPGPAATVLAQFYSGGPHNFLRTIGADHIQVAADVELARRLGVRRIGVVFNQFGILQQQEEHWFEYTANRLGAIHVVPLFWTGGAQRLASEVAGAHVDGIFLTGATTPDPRQAGDALRAIRRVLGPEPPIIVTDWQTPWSSLAGAGPRIYGTSAGVALASQLPSATQALLRTFPPRLRIAWSVAPTARATEVLLAAIASSDGTRRSVIRQLFSSRLNGRSIFDRYGDPVTAPVTVFRIRAGAPNATGVAAFRGGVVDAVITPSVGAIAPG
ncbi:MAG TPA: BTAD domain-containing putative transcriptional regulator [Gaiellaceae bacterium]|nr:BTAD domain-containing putative transcriptional regulator [Gaiellaceae bacterium]